MMINPTSVGAAVIYELPYFYNRTEGSYKERLLQTRDLVMEEQPNNISLIRHINELIRGTE